MFFQSCKNVEIVSVASHELTGGMSDVIESTANVTHQLLKLESCFIALTHNSTGAAEHPAPLAFGYKHRPDLCLSTSLLSVSEVLSCSPRSVIISTADIPPPLNQDSSVFI